MVLVRIHNATGTELHAVRVYAPTPRQEPVDFGAIASNEYSPYWELPQARGVARIEAEGPQGHLSLQPYDLVGEEELPEGRYTYRVHLTRDRQHLLLTVNREPV